MGVFINVVCFFQATAQNNPDAFGNTFVFDIVVADKQHMITEPVYVSVSDTAIYRIFEKFKKGTENRFVKAEPKSPILLGVKLNPSLVKYYSQSVQSISKHYQTFIISDSTDAVLIAMGINSTNLRSYQYRVVENDSTELIPWSPIPKLEQKYGAKQPYGFIGKFNSPGKRIMVEVVHHKNYGIREGVIFDWRVNFKPIVEEIQIGTPKSYFNLAYQSLNKGYATRFDKKTGLPLDFKFPADSVSSIGLNFKKQETIVHTVFLISSINGITDTSRLGYVDQYDYYRISNDNFNKPGRYEIIIKQQQKINIWDDAQMVRIPFEVLSAPLSAKTFSVKQLIPYIAATVTLFILVIAGLRLYNKRKLKKSQQQQATVQLKLKTIRSQLNPHFMFNALSSIQNLMNKDNLLEANHYLAKFAGLTRKVLNTSEQEMISLEEELKIAEDYLQMEQLRFGFKYELETDDNLDIINIEIPAMLLQPFIENAVKHGIAILKEKGHIKVKALKNSNDLVLSVTDNGKGFDTKTVKNAEPAFGLKLSQERINLINQLYKNQPATLNIISQPDGTSIQITLTNWI